jgi:uncharacterized membrane protein YbhN (UPF0104 family)
MRNILINVGKLLLVAALLYWLVDSGKLDLQQIAIIFREPRIMLFNFLVWGLLYVGLGSLRWNLLLAGVGLKMPFFRVLNLQLIGFFFNTAMPGSVGGDIVKAVYVIREQQADSKTPAMLTVLLDRIIGLTGLFVLAGIAVFWNSSFLVNHPTLMPLATFVVVGLIAIAIGLGVVFYPFPDGKDPIRRLLSLRVPGFKILYNIYDALRRYRTRPLLVLGTVLLSVLIQLGAMTYALFLTERLTAQSPDPGVFAAVFPIGVMATALPLAPGGLGVGHVAFERLYALAGWTGGANVFNIMVLGQLSLNLLGVFPYLLFRTRLPKDWTEAAALSKLQAP